MSPRERIENLARQGVISPAEEARLLAALSALPAPSVWSSILRPFDRLGGGVAAVMGLAISIASVPVALHGVRFDGFLDLHLTPAAVPLRTALVDQAIAWILPAVLFFGYARSFARHVRLVDFLGMTGLSRLPLLAGALPLLAICPPTPGALAHPPSARLLAVALVSLVLLVLNVSLLYQGFKNASGLAGPKLVAGFIGMLLGVELLSKLALGVLL